MPDHNDTIDRGGPIPLEDLMPNSCPSCGGPIKPADEQGFYRCVDCGDIVTRGYSDQPNPDPPNQPDDPGGGNGGSGGGSGGGGQS